MKKTKLCNSIATLSIAAMLALSMSACSNGSSDDSSSSSNVTNESAKIEDLNDAAFTVLRSLTNLTKYDENVVETTDEDGTVSYSGIETLPDGWQSMKFTCDEGYVLDETKPKVRSIPVNGFGDALEFFSGVIGEALGEEDLSNGSYNWTFSGLGSLTFRKATGDNLFATLDVNISVMSELSQLRFISKEDPALTSSNSYKGKPYYHAGDIIRRNKDNTYWICVRPSGGPYAKDKSYWISLDAFDNKSTKNLGKTTIKTETKKYELWYNVGGKDDEGRDKYEKFTQEWVYAKNLMSLKTAKAAFHTFACLVEPKAEYLAGYLSGGLSTQALYEDLINTCGINLLALHRDAESKDGASQEFINDSKNSYLPAEFIFAYGSPKTDKNRDKKINNPESDEFRSDIFKKIGQVSYVQPFVSGIANVEGEILKEELSTVHTIDPNNTTYKNLTFLLSLTDSFDTAYLSSTTVSETEFPSYPGNDNAYKASKFLYDAKNFLHGLVNCESDSKPGPLQYNSYDSLVAQYKPNNLGWHVIISPELVINDNKGNANSPKKPVTEKDYKDIYVQEDDQYFDYWDTFDSCERTVDNKKVDWEKENK